MDSNTKTVEIYVRLLGEGTLVFRPTLAVPLGEERFKLLATDNYDPKDELWEFPPGSVVKGQLRQFDGDTVLIAESENISENRNGSN